MFEITKEIEKEMKYYHPFLNRIKEIYKRKVDTFEFCT